MKDINKDQQVWFLCFLIRGSGEVRGTSRAGANVNEVAVQDLYKPVMKFKRRQAYTMSEDNIWAADLPEIG